jgi:hypothetical protein
MRALKISLLLVAILSGRAAGEERKATEKKPDLALTAVGRQHHTIQTSSKEAQDYFDQGMTFIYGFNHEEAARAFRHAATLDPASPMPLWGIALSVGPNYNIDVNPEREKTRLRNCPERRKARRASAAG